MMNRRYISLKQNEFLSDGIYYLKKGSSYKIIENNQVRWMTNKNFNVIFHIKDKKIHREDGPAFIINSVRFEWWYINGFNVTKDVYKWIAENKFPRYTKWKDHHKILFKLRFC